MNLKTELFALIFTCFIAVSLKAMEWQNYKKPDCPALQHLTKDRPTRQKMHTLRSRRKKEASSHKPEIKSPEKPDCGSKVFWKLPNKLLFGACGAAVAGLLAYFIKRSRSNSQTEKA